MYFLLLGIACFISFSEATPCENCGSCIPILEYCNVLQDSEDFELNSAMRAKRAEPNPDFISYRNIGKESQSRCILESFLGLGNEKPTRNYKCQVP